MVSVAPMPCFVQGAEDLDGPTREAERSATSMVAGSTSAIRSFSTEKPRAPAIAMYSVEQPSSELEGEFFRRRLDQC